MVYTIECFSICRTSEGSMLVWVRPPTSKWVGHDAARTSSTQRLYSLAWPEKGIGIDNLVIIAMLAIIAKPPYYSYDHHMPNAL